jgi:cytochrome b561
MAAQADPFLNPLAHAFPRRKMLLALSGCAGLLVVVIGVLGLLDGSWLRQMLESWINIHALFGFLLCGLVLARYQWRTRDLRCMLPADIRELSRHLSRIVYLLLYVVIGVRQSIGIINSIWHGSAVDFDLFDDRFRNGPDRAGWNPKDDFQLFLATGLFALILVRVFTFRLWLRSVTAPNGRSHAANASPLDPSDRQPSALRGARR